MSTLRFISKSALKDMAAGLAARARVLAPAREGCVVVFKEYSGGEPMFARSSVAPKEALLPACENLFTFRFTREAENPLKLDDSREAKATVIFACRPCDAKGVAVMDRPYLRGPYRDPYYAERRARLLVISQTCNAPCTTCFCDWLGGGPADPEGSDILMTELEDGFLLEAVSEEGEKTLNDGAFAPLFADGAARMDAASAVRRGSLEMRPPAPDLAGAREALAARFGDAEFWRNMTEQCLSCGACTYMCPTCYCFNISDETEGETGRRLRSRDSCMSPLFTREASGHNPRTDKALRMRNRVMHKFSWYPTVWNGAFSCSGCGRCITNCPVHLDIRHIVLSALADGQA
jgi:ferredoxin